MDNDPPLPDIPAEVLDYLASNHTLTLATTAYNLPHAATVVYVNRAILLYVCMRRESTPSRNIALNPAIAFTIDQYTPDWDSAKSIAGVGEADEITAEEDIRLLVLRFQDKFPLLTNVDSANLAFYRITPTSMEYIDNQQEGRKHESGVSLDYAHTTVFNLFHQLPPRQLDEISASLEPLSLPAGAVIVKQGDTADRFFIIVEGEVEVSRDDNGTVTTIDYLGRGQYFGEIGVLMDSIRTATVTARVPTQLLAMPRDLFRSIVAQSLSVSEDFDAVLAQRLTNLSQYGAVTNRDVSDTRPDPGQDSSR
jgi:CRP-like cAMP-binding protein/nitroimidazol reductase NimA-like FMN-containing flavoprotein (pyridoxamine 5'-phosphate oxidase superfamily)